MPLKPSNPIHSIISPTSHSPSFSPSTAAQALTDHFNRRDYASYSTLDLLGLQEKLLARQKWCYRFSHQFIDEDKHNLDQIVKELDHPSRQPMAKDRAEFALRNKWLTFYPDEGPYRRELYGKHIQCFAQGKLFNERLFLGSNRSGKTVVGAYETTCHTTGNYPDWWPGKVFEHPIEAWVVNNGAKDVRDINEAELLGPVGNIQARGTGMIPHHRIGRCVPKAGTPNAVEFIYVEHVSGGTSSIQSKSFDQGRLAFQGTRKEFIWPDEECPMSVYEECFLRTMPTGDFAGGLILATYTPILGLTDLTVEFLKAANIEIGEEGMKEKTNA